MRSGRVTRSLAAPALALALAVVLAACGSGAAGSADGPVPTAVPTTAPSPATGSVLGPTTATTPPSVGGELVDTFPTVAATVRGPGGEEVPLCLLHATTAPLRRRGLMEVVDPALEGCDGMLFTFPADTTSGFWMRSTRLPLTITWLAADGAVLGQEEMVPCPDGEDCPGYLPPGPYRHVLEVPTVRAGDLAIGPGSVVDVGTEACAPAA